MSERAPLAEKVRTARTLVHPAWDDARALQLTERTVARARDGLRQVRAPCQFEKERRFWSWER